MVTIKNPITVVQGGESPSTPSQWGRLWYYPFTLEFIPQNSDAFNCTATVVDQSLLQQYVSDAGGMGGYVYNTFEIMMETYDGETWNVSTSEGWGPDEYSTEDLESSLGVSVTITDPNDTSANFYIRYAPNINTSGTPLMMELAQGGYTALGTLQFYRGYGIELFDNLVIPYDAIYKFEFGTQPTSTPDYFLSSYSNLAELDNSNWNVTTIGSVFMAGCKNYNQPIILDGVTTIGNNFLAQCDALSSDITLPSTITSIGANFMSYCNNFTGNLICETSTAPTDNGSLSTFSSTSPIYATGVTLTGTYAQTWKNALPDRNVSPYRKLIVGS